MMKLYTFTKLILSTSITAIFTGQTFAATSIVGGARAVGTDTVAIGERAFGTGNSAVTVGFSSTADGSNATAIGGGTNALDGATAIGDSAIAIGGGVRNDNDTSQEKKAANAIGEAAIAIGQASSASGGGAIALGQASVSIGNNVALGSDSTAIAQLNKDAYLTETTATSYVSVGKANTAEQGDPDNSFYRRIQNVADGADDQDAVTVAQLKKIQAQIVAVDPDLVQQDSTTNNITVAQNTGGTSINMSGTDGDRVVSGLANGQINANSTDAVNGSQLNNVQQQIDGLGPNLLQQDSTTNNITVAQNTGGTSINMSGTDGDRVVSGVANGQINANSTDAVNGSQLNNVQQQIDGLGPNLLQQDSTTNNITVAQNTGGTSINMSGTDGDRVVSGVANGQINANSTDAVNGSQLNTNYNVLATSLGGNASYQDGSWTAPTYTIGTQEYSNVGDALREVDNNLNSLDTRVSSLESIFVSNNEKFDHLNKRVDEGLAMAAALNGLFQPYNVGNMNVSVAAGGYNSQHALAVGSGFRVNEKFAIKAGAAFTQGGQGKILYNVGTNFEW